VVESFLYGGKRRWPLPDTDADGAIVTAAKLDLSAIVCLA
jgi:hypothetical protein